MAVLGIYPVFFVIFNAVATSAVYSGTSCGKAEFACSSGKCIPAAKDCNGQFDCEDGSDELLSHCKDSGRPIVPILFHCTVPWTRELYPGVCHSVCLHKTDYCSYALMAEHGTPGTCKLPPYPENGNYHVEDQLKTDTFSLYYSCAGNFDLDGPNYPRCEDGTWLNKHPVCQPISSSSGIEERDIR